MRSHFATRDGARDHWPWLILALVLAFTAYVRWRFLDVPLDRDEGEYAYIAQQMLRGVPPYESGYAMKMPGIYVAYAMAISCFGESSRGIHLGLAVVNAASIVLMSLIVRRWQFNGAIAAATFALLTLDVEVQGSAAQAEQFVLLPALAGAWMLQAVFEPTRAGGNASPRHSWWRLFIAGFCFGAAGMIKQHGFSFGLFAAWYVLYQWWHSTDRPLPRLVVHCGILALGIATPFMLVCAWMRAEGVFGPFWYWTVTYASIYTTSAGLSAGVGNLLSTGWDIVASLPLVWSLVAVGFSALFWYDKARRRRAIMLAFLCCSFLGTVPGFYFRTHYFLFIMPAAAILSAVGSEAIARTIGSALRLRPAFTGSAAVMAVAAACLGISVWSHREYLFRATPNQVARLAYWSNPFPEAVEIARYINAESRERGPIMVLGSEPQIYFYTGRRAASPHIYMYPLMEDQPFAVKMQLELLADIDTARPEWVILEMFDGAWGRRPGPDSLMMGWVRSVLFRDYEQVGAVDVDDAGTQYRWNRDPSGYEPSSSIHLAIFRRKSNVRG
jgi:hypothetical protein